MFSWAMFPPRKDGGNCLPNFLVARRRGAELRKCTRWDESRGSCDVTVVLRWSPRLNWTC